jgi:hypothetical protein
MSMLAVYTIPCAHGSFDGLQPGCYVQLEKSVSSGLLPLVVLQPAQVLFYLIYIFTNMKYGDRVFK